MTTNGYLKASIFTTCCCLSLFMGQAALAGKRALVLGVSEYDNYASLPNATRDSDLIAERLQSIGFDVEQLKDATSFEYLQDIDLERDEEDASVLFIYFSGHGVQVLGENFLLFRDAEVRADAASGVVPLSDILKRFSRMAENVVIVLDSCRDNPLEDYETSSKSFVSSYPEAYSFYNNNTVEAAEQTSRSAGADQGMGRVDAQPSNVLLAYATRAGSVSFDGVAGTHSPFAAALAESVSKPDVEITRTFREVRDRVLAVTKGRQEPFIYGSLGSEDLYLNPEDCPCDRAAIVPPEVKQCQSEAAPIREGFPFGKEVAAINPKTAIPACQAALDSDPNNPMLHFWTGRAYSAARQDEAARDHYLVAAQSHVPGAMHNLALLYDGGRDFGLDADRAFYWFNQANDAGEPLARSHLAWYYETGRAGDIDLEKAFELYHASAEAGEKFAQRKLGYLYKLGMGVEASSDQSINWFRLASANGDVDAMNELSVALLAKEDASSVQQGLGWMILSWANGYKDAGSTLENILNGKDGEERFKDLAERILGKDGRDSPANEVVARLKEQVNSSWLVDLRNELISDSQK